jgi:hypothetical protein
MSSPAERSPSSHVSHGASGDGARGGVNETLAGIAERALGRALMVQRRPTMVMYMHPSTANDAAFERAVREICSEAHRLDVRAEELLIGIKQAWSQLAAERARHLGDRDGDVLREVVSSSIEVFFGPAEEPERGRH